VQQNIAWLDVPMHDVVLGEGLKGLEHVHEVQQCFGLSEMPVVLDEPFQCAPIAVLIDEVVVIDGLEDLHELDDMVVLLDFGEGLDFVDGALLEFGAHLELLDLDDFDGHKLVGAFVGGLVDFTVLALAHDLLQVVVLDLLNHCFSVNNYYLLITCQRLTVF
jgi:hypothetical protein